MVERGRQNKVWPGDGQIFTIVSLDENFVTLTDSVGQQIVCSKTVIPPKCQIDDKLVVSFELEEDVNQKRLQTAKELLEYLLNEG